MSEIRVPNLAEPTTEEIKNAVRKRAEEVLNIIRCKDCKYWETKEGLHDWCKNKMLYMNAYDFCSRGVRKDGEL